MQEPFPSPGGTSQPIIESLQPQAAMLEKQLTEAYKAAASNFYTIAVFSLINSLISLLQLNVYFPIGLGITQVIDAIAYGVGSEIPDSKTLFIVIGLALDLAILGGVALFGFLISKRTGWLIPLGSALYLFDGLILLVFSDWIGAAFHAYFLYRIYVSWQAVRAVTKESAPPSAIGF